MVWSTVLILGDEEQGGQQERAGGGGPGAGGGGAGGGGGRPVGEGWVGGTQVIGHRNVIRGGPRSQVCGGGPCALHGRRWRVEGAARGGERLLIQCGTEGVRCCRSGGRDTGEGHL